MIFSSKAFGRLLAVFIAMAVALVIAPTAASSAPSGQASPQADADIEALIKANPGAKRIGDNRIRLENGVIAETVYCAEDTTSKQGTQGCGECAYGWLCLWDSTYYNGSSLRLYHCGFVNIGSVHGWNDRIRSYRNNQTPGTTTLFFDVTGGDWWHSYTSWAPDNQPLAPVQVYYVNGITVC
ncbi:hypothetical protein GCM10029963_24670 [Micromonospora andamanensis]|uniref:peptidase inhibitor family I36 protein n=1 Tax=Micromonospora andamanensis TaxID=1287068 RepID=UPI00194EB956|nr:peptidase inhibitor family I36 protein [Micromonospora andamanensis]GIJ38352.1 hypothetical protein Vwe01_16770 [Micromonospora andamanensis]